VNQAVQIKRDKHLNVKPYEFRGEHNGHANGFKPKTVKTRVGEVTFDILQVREGDFYPEALEKGLRSE
jgi:putative transposase